MSLALVYALGTWTTLAVLDAMSETNGRRHGDAWMEIWMSAVWPVTWVAMGAMVIWLLWTRPPGPPR